ncbi:Putative dynamin stalk domain, dynamin, GTPase domain-containing protein [Septoria linicola]|uniref:Dynamin stalk domain, dynamin, GTPase domain-containing protein n=1 Tax=Septoria linicola TaxID=215465 RepID=A0A9Q9B1E2_9PEZI|nr:Putative dynamin stalk domain, dynamin, GTPase domain-containing protein [Septoria linicola]
MSRLKREPSVEDLTVDDHPTLDTTYLDGLQNQGVRTTLEAVDELQTCGLGDLLKLPEIVVPFPQAENQLQSFQDFPQLIKDAKKYMGLKDLGPGRNAFSTHRLHIDITGPTRGHFSLLDLPGLIRTTTDVQTTHDIAFVKRLHNEVLANSRAIILAVMSATVDLAVHEILTICEQHDPQGTRTLGIITKPDRLTAGSKQEEAEIGLFRNKGKTLKLGWHVVMNQSMPGKDQDFAARNVQEDTFLSSDSWKTVVADRKGISGLRDRISSLRFEQSKRRLPELEKETAKILAQTIGELEALGEKRTDVNEQRRALRIVSLQVFNLVRDAVAGNYKDTFFPSLDKQVARDKAKMEIRGHKFEFLESPAAAGTNTLCNRKWTMEPAILRMEAEKKLSRAEAVNWVRKLHKATRGSELPGTFSTSLVWDAFHE